MHATWHLIKGENNTNNQITWNALRRPGILVAESGRGLTALLAVDMTWHDNRREREERNEWTHRCKTTRKKDSKKDRYKNQNNSKYDAVTNISTSFLPLISIRSSNCISWFVTGHVFVRSKCFSINLFSNNKPVFLEITPCVGTSPETTSHNNRAG